jgi:hypothetical protein
MYDLKETREYCKLQEEALDRTLWRTRFGRDYVPVTKHITEWMTDIQTLVHFNRSFKFTRSAARFLIWVTS